MDANIVRLADEGDILGLKYAFVDSLDVDPTFREYEEDYEYCKSIPGLLEPHKELTPFVDDVSKWDEDYWAHLKMDLVENFSDIRMMHMREVAKVFLSSKYERIMEERQLLSSNPSSAFSATPQKTGKKQVHYVQSDEIGKGTIDEEYLLREDEQRINTQHENFNYQEGDDVLRKQAQAERNTITDKRNSSACDSYLANHKMNIDASCNTWQTQEINTNRSKYQALDKQNRKDRMSESKKPATRNGKNTELQLFDDGNTLITITESGDIINVYSFHRENSCPILDCVDRYQRLNNSTPEERELHRMVHCPLSKAFPSNALYRLFVIVDLLERRTRGFQIKTTPLSLLGKSRFSGDNHYYVFIERREENNGVR